MTGFARILRFSALVLLPAAGFALSGMLAGCSQFVDSSISPAKRQLSAETRALLFQKGMREESPIFIRIFKQESELEVWKARDDGRFYHFKTYPICRWSGKLGPKLKQGDKQAPEGFYQVAAHQLNPASRYHLSFNLGYPNAFDKSHNRTGDYLMVHGDCKSAGCYAMTNALMEEIYALVRESLDGGQKRFHVHAFPFRMTAENMKKYRRHRWARFWRNLKQGYDQFEKTRLPPKISVCERRYLINAIFLDGDRKPDPRGSCPPYQQMTPGALPARLRPSHDILAGGSSAQGRPLHRWTAPHTASGITAPRALGFASPQ